MLAEEAKQVKACPPTLSLVISFALSHISRGKHLFWVVEHETSVILGGRRGASFPSRQVKRQQAQFAHGLRGGSPGIVEGNATARSFQSRSAIFSSILTFVVVFVVKQLLSKTITATYCKRG